VIDCFAIGVCRPAAECVQRDASHPDPIERREASAASLGIREQQPLGHLDLEPLRRHFGVAQVLLHASG
jgi:hypothetical protein